MIRKCRCGASFDDDNGRSECVNCTLARANRPAGQRQATPPPPTRGNAAYVIDGAPAPDRRSYSDRLAEGFAMLGGM
jgi:hypothetical protein